MADILKYIIYANQPRMNLHLFSFDYLSFKLQSFSISKSSKLLRSILTAISGEQKFVSGEGLDVCVNVTGNYPGKLRQQILEAIKAYNPNEPLDIIGRIHNPPENFKLGLMTEELIQDRNPLKDVEMTKGDSEEPSCDDEEEDRKSQTPEKAYQLTYGGQQIFYCSYEGCKKAFISRAFLERHENVHTKEKQFECKVCDFKTFNSTAFNKHSSLHNEMNMRNQIPQSVNYATNPMSSNVNSVTNQVHSYANPVTNAVPTSVNSVTNQPLPSAKTVTSIVPPSVKSVINQTLPSAKTVTNVNQDSNDTILFTIPSLNKSKDFKDGHWSCFYRQCADKFKKEPLLKLHLLQHFREEFFSKVEIVNSQCPYCASGNEGPTSMASTLLSQQQIFNHVLLNHSLKQDGKWDIPRPPQTKSSSHGVKRTFEPSILQDSKRGRTEVLHRNNNEWKTESANNFNNNQESQKKNLEIIMKNKFNLNDLALGDEYMRKLRMVFDKN